MIKLSSILIQSILLIIAGAVLGFIANSLNSEPLTLVREVIPPEVLDEMWDTVTAEEVLKHVEEGTAIMIDARDPNEYEAGHITGALNLPDHNFMESYQEIGDSLPREIPLVVYCQGGQCDQSHSVLEQLKEFGFEQLFLYKEGWNDWKDKGYPSEP
jgi:rhodanese-related sulfurtransferase